MLGRRDTLKVHSCSYSSDKKLSRCEQQFSYRYDQGLKPKIKKVQLFKGSLVHEILRAYYLGKDWKEEFNSWKEKTWVPMFDEEKQYYGDSFPDEVYDLLLHYTTYWAETDKDWKIILVERKFSLPTKFGFPVTWISDLIIRDGKWMTLVETKTAKKLPESEERILAPQVHAYCYLLRKVGININRILWNYLRTEPVPEPQILQSGLLSQRKINTDQRTYWRAVKKAGLDKYPEYMEIAKSLPKTVFLLRVPNAPDFKVGELFVRDWIERHRRAFAHHRHDRAVPERDGHARGEHRRHGGRRGAAQAG